MLGSNRLLVVTHPVLTAIGSADIDRAIPKSRRSAGFDFVEVAPMRTVLAEEYDLDWNAARDAQEKLFVEKLRPHLEGREQLAYFGFAPVPLAIHLGYRVQSTIKIDVYQRNHGRQDWVWAPTGKASTRSFLEPIRFPTQGSSAPGAVIIRVSTSARIAPKDTEELVPECLAAVDIALASPHPDALETRGALNSVVDAFTDVLTRLRNLYPNLTTIHLFAAVPVGLAFQLGSRINPTMNPEVVTYQYDAKRSPHYKKAIVLGVPPLIPEAKPIGKTTTPWRGKQLITGNQETFLEIAFLHEGLRIAKSVVRLIVSSHKGAVYSGTGFLIAPNTILTNHHVLHDEGDSNRLMKHVDIWFNYELDERGRQRRVDAYEGAIETISGDATHDWAIIQSKTPISAEYPLLDLHPSKPVLVGDYVYIIQHPAGKPKKIGLLHNQVVDVTSDRVQYLTDTLPGSSGSPVCNELWQVVALHYRGVEESIDTTTSRKNEGIHIERVVEGLRSRKIID